MVDSNNGKTALPCGAWPSPLAPQNAAAAAMGLGTVQSLGQRLYWLESRPEEAGRNALMCASVGGAATEVLGKHTNVRSRVHEYGGTPYAVGAGLLLWADFASQRLRLRQQVSDADAEPADQPFTPEGCRYADFDVHPNGQQLLAVREDHRQPGEPHNGVVLLDLKGGAGAGTVLYGDSDFVAWPRWDRRGERIALVAWQHPHMPWDDTRLVVGRVVDNILLDVQVVAGGAGGEAVLEPQWADDGSLYFLSDREGAWALWRWQAGAAPQVAALQGAARQAPQSELGGALWNLGLRTYALCGDQALLRHTRQAHEALLLAHLPSGTVQALRLCWQLDNVTHVLDAEQHPGAVSALGWLGPRQAWALVAPADGPAVLLTFALPPLDASGSDTTALTVQAQVVRAAGPQLLPLAAVSRPQHFSYATTAGADGQARDAHAWFYPPSSLSHQPSVGEKPPLLVLLHGGPTSHSTSALALLPQFWASRGFAVVHVNYGGSTGFGRAYRERLRGEWGVVDLADAVAAVDALAALGWVDGQRVAIRGGSAGGFTVLSALAFTKRFAAGINYFGVADLQTLVADTHKFEARYVDGLVAPLPEGQALYRARSPVHHMAQAHGALLTLQGSDDKAVPPQQSRDIVAAAKVAGCRVAYLEFAGEGHGFRRAENIVRGLQAELAFLGEVFGFTPADEVPALAWES